MLSTGLKGYYPLKFIRLAPTNAVKFFDCGDSKVYAYCSLANDKVAITDFKDKAEFNRFRKKRGFPNEKRLKSYPADKLCRLGVASDAKRQQIGTTMLDYIKSMFVIENKTGCRFLTVDAYLDAVPFYEKNGFRFLTQEDDDPHTRLMYFDLLDIA